MNQTLPQSVDEMKDIIDIEGIVVSATPDLIKMIAVALLVLIVLVVLFVLIRKLIRKFRDKDSLLSPEDRAFKYLNKLQKRDLLKEGDVKTYYFILDEILRRYMFDKFKYDVLDKTYEELKHGLQKFSALFLKQEMPLFIKFLDRGQLAKFARMPVDKIDADLDYNFVKDFVTRTKNA